MTKNKEKRTAGKHGGKDAAVLSDEERKKIIDSVLSKEAKRREEEKEDGQDEERGMRSGRGKEEKTEKDKRLIIWSGVTFFMLLISLIWFYNIKQTLLGSAIGNGDVSPEAASLGGIMDMVERKTTTEESSPAAGAGPDAGTVGDERDDRNESQSPDSVSSVFPDGGTTTEKENVKKLKETSENDVDRQADMPPIKDQ